MKLYKAFGLLNDLWISITISLLPTAKAVLRNPLLIFQPRKLSSLYLANLWVKFGDGVDSAAKDVKESLITPYAYGTVLDIGAGHGHTVRYLPRDRVTRYIALEPNTLMHPHIRAQAHGAGFHEADGTLLILSCGAEQTTSILSTIASSSGPAAQDLTPPVDTVISILTLCTVPEPERCVAGLVRDVLKPGGQLLIYEHVLSKLQDVAWWQRFWTPVWALGFDGCRLDRPTDDTVSALQLVNERGEEESAWAETKMWGKEGEDSESLFLHTVGRFVKK